MAQSKWNNKITISIGDDKGRIDFKEHATGFQFMAVYDRLENVEEVPENVSNS